MSNNSTEPGLVSSPFTDHTAFNTAIMTIKAIIICIAIGGSILTITAICRFRYLRYPSNMMIAALAVSDLLMVTVYTPSLMIRSNNPDVFSNRAACLTVMFIGQITVVGNIVFLSLLSMERFYAVYFPFHYHKNVTMRFNFIWSLATLLGVILLNLPSVCGIDKWTIYKKCYSPLLFPRWYSTLYISVLLVFQIIGLLSTFSVLIAELRIRRRDRNLRMSDFERQNSLQSTIMIMAYGISVCLYLPHILYYLCMTFLQLKPDYILLETLFVLDLCSPAVNCFIYSFKHSKFRKAYKTLLGCKNCQVEPLTLNDSQITS